MQFQTHVQSDKGPPRTDAPGVSVCARVAADLNYGPANLPAKPRVKTLDTLVTENG